MVKRRFEFIAGCLALDFIDTVANRNAAPVDLLETEKDLANWFARAGLRLGGDELLLRNHLFEAKRLREAIFQAAVSVHADEEPETAQVDIINKMAARPDLRPQWIDGKVLFSARSPALAALSRVAADAVACLSLEGRDRLRRCPECKMLFRDNSRGQKRIWCSSANGCGNRAKVRRHRAQQAVRTT